MPSTYTRTVTGVPLWFDCDPGNDDAFALLLAAFHPSFSLVGISTVHGNVSLKKTTRNVLALLETMKFRQEEIKVYAGEATPLQLEPLHAEDIHGNSGIGGAQLPENPKLVASTDMSYLEAMHMAVLQHEGEICFACTGTLTNMAKFIQKYPEDAAKIKFVSIMGGAFSFGNITPYAEFNLHVDPHAASLVLNAACLAGKIILAPLNITHTALATEHVCRAISGPSKAKSSPLREMFVAIIEFSRQVYERAYHHYSGPPLHDPLALFLLLPMIASSDPQLESFTESCDFHYLQRHLDIATAGKHSGQTTYRNSNLNPLRTEKGGVFVGQSVNIPIFWNHILSALEAAEKQYFKRT